MKIARIMGLAVIAAVVLMVSLGVGSAVAIETTLCKTTTEAPLCPTADRYPANTAIEASASKVEFKATLLGTNIEISCTSSTLKGETTAVSGEPQSLKVTALSFGGCKEIASGKACEAFEGVGLPYTASLAYSKGSNGTITSEKADHLFVSCGPMNCNYASPVIEVKGGSSGQLSIAEQTLTKTHGFACPSTSTLKLATYTISTPKPVYVARSKATAMCKVAENLCSVANLYPSGTTLTAAMSGFTIEPASGSIFGKLTCNEASITTSTQALYGEPLPVALGTFSLKGCGYEKWAKTCASVSYKPGFSGSVKGIATYGYWTSSSPGEIWAECGGFTCVYAVPSGSQIAIEAGAPGHMNIWKWEMSVTGGSSCGTSAVMTDRPTLTSPSGSLYFTDAIT